MTDNRSTQAVAASSRKIDRSELPESVLSISDDFNPLSEGVFMKHQSEWVGDQSNLKLCRKGRRTGITWAEAQDDTLIAAASRSAGGDNVFYIGDTKEKGLEFIGYCAHFAKFIEGAIAEIWEGETEVEYLEGNQQIVQRLASYTIRFKSGFRITALASRPAVIRGLQGVVVIDEAAFHNNVKGVIDACNALLIWGGRIRVISTHNGVLNAFNELIKETEAGKWPYSMHTVTFDDAVENGLYERVCLVKGWKLTPEGKQKWYSSIRNAYGTRLDVMRQELDVIPLEGGGTMLPLAWIEACMTKDYSVVRWEAPEEEFIDWPEAARRAHMDLWLRDNVLPILEKLPTGRLYALGEDFAMRVDRSSMAIGYRSTDLIMHIPLILELRGCPYDQQEQALFYVLDRLHRFQNGIMDANGNGMVLAQKTRQRYGRERILELMATDAWYREYSPKLREAFESRSILMPEDADTTSDLKQFQMSDSGTWKIPKNVRTIGTDDGKRHADNAIGIINLFAALDADIAPIEHESTGIERESMSGYAETPQSNNLTGFSDTGFGAVSGGLNTDGY